MRARILERRPASAARAVERAGVEVLAIVLALLPLAVALVRSVRREWRPLGDNALVEIRSRDVFTSGHFPLLGTWSSASQTAGKHLNHPGPLLFDLLAVPVKVFGGPVGVAVGVTVINAAAIVGVAVTARRIGGRSVCLVATAVATTLAWTLGSELLISPWNPHVLVLPCLCLLVVAWAVATGELGFVPWMLALASLCLQTHLGYAYFAPAVCLLAVVGAALAHRSSWSDDVARRAASSRRAGASTRAWVPWSMAVVGVLWAQPLWEQFFSDGEGNLSRLLSSRAGDEQAIGISLGARIVGAVVALPPWWGRPSFTETVPFTPLAPGGDVVTPEGLPSLAGTVVGLLIVGGLLAFGVAAAGRRRDRVALAACGLAAAVLLAALATFTVVPVGTLGLTSHQMRWVWPLGGFVAFALAVALMRTQLFGAADVERPLVAAALVVVLVVVALNLPGHVHPDGPAAASDAVASARALARQFDGYDPGPGGIVFETANLRFSEPYSTVVMSALQRNGIDFFVEDEGMVRQLGEARRFDGRAQTRLFLLEDRPALDVPAGATRVALATPLSGAEVVALLDGEQQITAWITANGLPLTAEGRVLVGSGSLGVTIGETDAAASDAARLVSTGAVARLATAGALDLPPDVTGAFQVTARLRGQVDLRTVAVFAQPAL
jgi:hypothetical protein